MSKRVIYIRVQQVYKNQKLIQKYCADLEGKVCKTDGQLKKLVEAVSKFDTANKSLANFEGWAQELNKKLYNINNSVEFVAEGG